MPNGALVFEWRSGSVGMTDEPRNCGQIQDKN